jgi:putative ABC transport system permease protein
MMERYIFNFLLAIEGVLSNKLRAILTALGIVFGVAAVIAMLAIGTGAQESILNQMKLIGTNNIVIKSKTELTQDESDSADQTSGQNQTNLRPWSPGLKMDDLDGLKNVLPTIEKMSPEILKQLPIVYNGKRISTNCVGTNNAFFDLNNIRFFAGSPFHQNHLNSGSPVCIIGKTVQAKLFNNGNALNEHIKVGNNWLKVIGVLDRRIASKESLDNLGLRDYNSDVYVPIKTMLIRYENRAYVSRNDIQGRGNDQSESTPNYHQLDRVVVRIDQTENLQASADVIARILKRRHQGLVDFEVEVPELLIQQQRKTQDTFNMVLAIIAGISLIVGGIGIMNIMLASILERIKEIGIRRSMGATKIDIELQFLFEAIFISLIGGLLGIALGVITANLISRSVEIPTVVSTWSIIISFGVAFSIGLIFGLLPAQKAANQDPIKALRSD